MKKTAKRVITLCLAVIMITSVMSIGSFAVEPNSLVYTSFGDSIPAGYGLVAYNNATPPTNDEELANYDFRVHDKRERVETAYPAVVSDTIKAKKTNYYAMCGYRTVELRALLDPDYKRSDLDQYMLYTLTGNVDETQSKAASEAYANGQISALLKENGFNAEFYKHADEFAKVIEEADVITLNFGSNDTMTYGMYNISTSNWVAEMGAGMLEGYERLKDNFDWIVGYILDKNPDVKIYVVGMYNPFRGATLTDTSYIQLGNLADSVVNLVNTYFMYSSKYATKYTYVNVDETESWGFETVSDVLAFTDSSRSWEFTVKVHPTEAGHKYMANQIVKAMNGKSTTTSLISKLINRVGDANDRTTSNFDKISTSIGNTNSSINAAVKESTDKWISQIKNIINSSSNGSSSSGGSSNASPAGSEIVVLEDVAFDKENHNAYVEGSNGYFRPEDSLTRAEAAQILYKLLSVETKEKYETNTNNFSDVSASNWFNKAVSTLVATGAIKGYTDNTFKPDQKITRAEFVKMVMSIAGVDSSAKPSFSDTSTTAWYSAYVGTAQKAGYVEGSNGKFRPSDNITRAEAVKIMNGVLGRTADVTYIGNNSKTVTTFADVPSSAWYYKDVMEAANGHNYTSTNNTETWTSLK